MNRLELERLIDNTEDAVNASRPLTEEYLKALAVLCRHHGVPPSAVLTWDVGMLIAAVVMAERLDLDRTLALVRSAALYGLGRERN